MRIKRFFKPKGMGLAFDGTLDMVNYWYGVRRALGGRF